MEYIYSISLLLYCLFLCSFQSIYLSVCISLWYLILVSTLTCVPSKWYIFSHYLCYPIVTQFHDLLDTFVSFQYCSTVCPFSITFNSLHLSLHYFLILNPVPFIPYTLVEYIFHFVVFALQFIGCYSSNVLHFLISVLFGLVCFLCNVYSIYTYFNLQLQKVYQI